MTTTVGVPTLAATYLEVLNNFGCFKTSKVIVMIKSAVYKYNKHEYFAERNIKISFYVSI